MNTSGGQNQRIGAIAQILGQVQNLGKSALGAIGTGIGGVGTGGVGTGGVNSSRWFGSSTGSFVGGESTSSFLLSTFFYFIMYVFILFIILLIVHFTYKPIFKFLPSDKGLINVPGIDDKKVYWNTKTQPPALDTVPKAGVNDGLDTQSLADSFSLSIDVLVKKLSESQEKNRVILIKAPRGRDFASPTGTTTDLVTYFADKASMIMYLDQTNNLNVIFFSNGGIYATRPIQNIPLNTPFRVGVVVEKKVFTVYLNGKYVFQRMVPGGFVTTGGNSKFFAPPEWGASFKSIFVQNLILWPRAIQSVEVREASPALALRPDFDAGEDPDAGYCAS